MYRLDVRRLFAVAGREIGVASALLVVALGAWGFVGIADEVVEGEAHALDLAVLQALRVAGQPNALVGPEWLHVAAVDITALGSVAVLTLLILAAFALLGSLKRWTEAWLLALGALSGVTVSQGLKAVFGRERPDEAYRVVEAVNAS
ncbi:MAG: phosphoesterase, partial [Caulobacter sp.]